jgi:HSP20 family protein
MKKEDVRLTVENGVLAISGERKFEKEEKGRKYHRIERAYGSFVRKFSLSEDADGSNVTANIKDGVLQVHLPKSVKAKQKTVEITIG